MTTSDTHYELKQKGIIYYHIITVAIYNGSPRKHHVDVIYLMIVQLVQTSKQKTRVDKDCTLQQTDSIYCTTITATADNGQPIQQHMDVIFFLS